MTHCVLIRAQGKQLDRLRGEANRVAREAKVDWWVEAREQGTAFCFETARAKTSFTDLCEEQDIPYAEA
jgi:hypothetical protein